MRSLPSLAVLTIAALAASVLPAIEAAAASITNRDQRSYALTIRAGSKSESRVLEPGTTARDVCPKGCIISWDKGNDYQIEAADDVSIEDGFMYYEGPTGGVSSSPNVPSLRPGR